MKALLVVDIQNDFCPGGSLAVSEGDQVVEPTNGLIENFVDAGMPVIFTRDWHPANHCSFSINGGIWPAHCVANTDGARFHSGLNIPGSAIIISKADSAESDAYSGFQGTDLDTELKRLGVDEVVTAGLATDYCVKNTVLDALKSGFRTSVAADCIRAVNVEDGDGEAAIQEMLEAGAAVLPSAELYI